MLRTKEEGKSPRKFKTTLVGVSGGRQTHKIAQPEGGVSGRVGGGVQVHGILDKVLEASHSWAHFALLPLLPANL